MPMAVAAPWLTSIFANTPMVVRDSPGPARIDPDEPLDQSGTEPREDLMTARAPIHRIIDAHGDAGLATATTLIDRAPRDRFRAVQVIAVVPCPGFDTGKRNHPGAVRAVWTMRCDNSDKQPLRHFPDAPYAASWTGNITMLEPLRSWLKARFASFQRATPQQARDSARLKREARAQTVSDLQAHVRLLQQQITDLTAGEESGGEGANVGAARAKVAQLEEQLATTQAELARYQGRI